MFRELLGSGKKSSLVEAAFRDFSIMLQQAARMLELALAALLDNADLEVDLDKMDDVVDDGERMVRRAVLEHLSISPRTDLVASLVLISMVQDAERIGDFARGLAELLQLARSPRSGPYADDLREIASAVQAQFETCERAFRDDDVELARQVIIQHTQTKPALESYTARLADSDLSADMAIVYGAAARILRRISAHLSNIASSVVQPFDRIRHGDEDV
jgi:phosphate uptake regulator